MVADTKHGYTGLARRVEAQRVREVEIEGHEHPALTRADVVELGVRRTAQSLGRNGQDVLDARRDERGGDRAAQVLVELEPQADAGMSTYRPAAIRLP